MFPTKDPHHHKIILLERMRMRPKEDGRPFEDVSHPDYKLIAGLHARFINKLLDERDRREIDRLWDGYKHHLRPGEEGILKCHPYIDGT